MRQKSIIIACAGSVMACATIVRAEGDFFNVNIGNRQSFAESPNAANAVLVVDVAAALELPSGTPMVLNGVGWNLVLQGIGASWLNEAQAHFTSPFAPGAGGPRVTPGMFFGPGNNNNQPMFFVIFTPVKLEFLEQSYLVLHDGMVRIELCESFDNGLGPDTNWVQGVLTLQAVPGCQRGDVNCDTSVNLNDVTPFIDALLDPTSLPAAAYTAVDINRDGLLNGADTMGFVECVLSAGCP